jgi:hypothetical protein
VRPKAVSDPAKKETKYTVVVNKETLGSAVLEVQDLLQSLEARIDSQVMCKVTPPRSHSHFPLLHTHTHRHVQTRSIYIVYRHTR